MEHTPGNWTCERQDDDSGDIYWAIHGKDYEFVVNVHDEGHFGTAQANAHLIAAAPEMKEALEAVRECCLFTDDDGSIGVTFDPSIPEELFARINTLLATLGDK